MSSPSSTKVVKIGVFVPGDAQLLDLACIDVFHMMSREYLSLIPILPAHIVELAPSVEIYYITSDANAKTTTTTTGDNKSETETEGKHGKDDVMIPLTSKVSIKATHTISSSSPDIAPGNLNILLVPGPDPSSSFDEPVLQFLRAHAEAANRGTDILSVCTGILLCGAAGLLDNGRTACGPRGIQDEIRKKHPGAKLVGEKWRWVKDGNFWSSGGITNGNDLVAAYARANSRYFPPPVVEIACKMADVGDRPQEYEQSQTMFTLSFVWQIVKGWFTKR